MKRPDANFGWAGTRLAAGLLCAGVLAAGAEPAPTAGAASLSAGNFTARLTITSVRAQPAYGATTAAAGRQFLVLAAKWENCSDTKLAAERGLPTAYAAGDLATHLYLVIDGARRGELLGNLEDGAGHKSLAGVVLAKPGAVVTGDLVFEIPAGRYTSADLRFYDDTGGDFSLALAGPVPAAPPLQPVQKNAVGEFALYAFSDPDRRAVAPPGFRAVAVDLRARSVWLADKEGSAYDPALAPGTMVKRVNLLDWSEVRQYLAVVADGAYAYPPAAGGDLPDTPRFIPEFFTGWRIVFFVPADARSLELIAEMPHAGTDEGTIDLAPLRFPLTGGKSAAAAGPGPLAIKDEMFAVTVAAHRTTTFAGEPAGEGKQFIVLDVGVTNEGETGEFFQPAEQLLLLDADGTELPPDDVTAQGSHRPMERVHLAPHMFRRFETVYRLDAAVTRPKLSYHGGSFMQAYELFPAP